MISTILHQIMHVGPVASQEAIMMLGNNGGGFFNTPARPATVVTARAVPINTSNGMTRMDNEVIFISI